MKTCVIKENDIKKKWLVVDADQQVLGRLATQIANVLMGKRKPYFQPNIDCGDYVIVINAEKVVLTGNKRSEKIYFRHTGYIGNQKYIPFEDMLKKKPAEIVKHAVKGMLPKNRLGRQLLLNLKVYAGTEHPHTAQQPELLKI